MRSIILTLRIYKQRRYTRVDQILVNRRQFMSNYMKDLWLVDVLRGHTAPSNLAPKVWRRCPYSLTLEIPALQPPPIALSPRVHTTGTIWRSSNKFQSILSEMSCNNQSCLETFVTNATKSKRKQSREFVNRTSRDEQTKLRRRKAVSLHINSSKFREVVTICELSFGTAARLSSAVKTNEILKMCHHMLLS